MNNLTIVKQRLMHIFGKTRLSTRQHLLIEQALQDYKNDTTNKFIEAGALAIKTIPEFTEFAKQRLYTPEKFDKKRLFEEFIETYPKLRKISQRMFTNWLREYGKVKGYRELKSNGKSYIIYN